MMNPRKSDFVQVRLTEAGRATHGRVHVANAHMSYVFEGDQEQRVIYRAEWLPTLSREMVDGKPMFEIVEAESEAESELRPNPQRRKRRPTKWLT